MSKTKDALPRIRAALATGLRGDVAALLQKAGAIAAGECKVRPTKAHYDNLLKAGDFPIRIDPTLRRYTASERTAFGSTGTTPL